jgi:hypothetical protein
MNKIVRTIARAVVNNRWEEKTYPRGVDIELAPSVSINIAKMHFKNSI